MAQIEFSGTVYFQTSGPWVFRPLMIHFWFVGTVYFMRGTVYFRFLMTHLGFLETVYFQREDRIFYAGGTVYFQHLRTVYFSRPYILSRGPYIFSSRTVYFQSSGPYIFSLDRIFYGWPDPAEVYLCIGAIFKANYKLNWYIIWLTRFAYPSSLFSFWFSCSVICKNFNWKWILIKCNFRQAI